jgi:Trypsin-co-occurring domain 2
MESRITLAQAIEEIRSQLESASVSSQSAPIRFIPKEVEVELDVTFRLEAEGGAGFKLLSLIDISGKAKRGDESTHKVTLTLIPVGTDGKPTLIFDTEREK